MTDLQHGESKFMFVGEQLSLDFINTLVPIDLLTGFTDLVSWLQQAKVLDAAAAKAAMVSWGHRPETKQLLNQVRRLRGALHEMAERLATGKPPGQTALEEINRVLAQETGYNHLVRGQDGFELRFQPIRWEAMHLLVPIARAAAELLRNGDPGRIRKCGNPVCVLYYYDTSKNRTRRWCSMAACGNRMKAAAFYRRSRKKRH